MHVVASLNVETGGPARSVRELADVQMEYGLDVTVATLDYPNLGRMLAPVKARLVTRNADIAAQKLRGSSLSFFKLVGAEAANHDIVHTHGLWMQPNLYARWSAAKHDKPLVISPRGMLE